MNLWQNHCVDMAKPRTNRSGTGVSPVCFKTGSLTPKFTGETPVPLTRPALARERARRARAMLAECRLCAHDCGVNRLAGEHGLCHAGARPRFFSAQVEVSDELELIPTFAIALSGCDLRCDFCITGAESWNPRAGAALTPAEMAANAPSPPCRTARGPSWCWAANRRFICPPRSNWSSLLPESAKLVWKTNAHGSAQARELLDGMFDVWLADFKFGNDACAQRLAKIPDYVRVVQENLRWANGTAN